MNAGADDATPRDETPDVNWMAVAILGGACVVGVWTLWAAIAPAPIAQTPPAYEHDGAPLPATRQVVLGAPGLYYEWLDVREGMQTVRDLARVPRTRLAALGVWSPEWGPRPEGAYVIDITGARSGDVIEARRRDRRFVHAAAHAADIGEAHAVLTEFLAGEIASFDPRSERQAASRRASKYFEDVEASRPPTYEEMIEAIRARAEQRAARRKPQQRAGQEQ